MGTFAREQVNRALDVLSKQKKEAAVWEEQIRFLDTEYQKQPTVDVEKRLKEMIVLAEQRAAKERVPRVVQDLKIELDRRQIAFRHLKDKQDQLIYHQEMLRKELKTEQEKNEALHTQKDSLLQELKELHEKEEIYRKRLQALQDELAYLQNTTEIPEELQESLHSLESKTSSFEAALLEAEVREEQLRKQLFEEEEHIKRQKARIEKLLFVIQEKDRKIGELQQFEYSFKKAAQQKKELEEAILKEQAARQPIEEECARLKENLEDACQKEEQLQKVIQFLRERTDEANVELGQLQEDYHAAKQHAFDLQETIRALEHTIQEKDQLAQEGFSEKEDAERELKEVSSQFASLKQALFVTKNEMQEKDREKDRLKDSLEQARERTESLQNLVNEKNEKLHDIERDLERMRQTLVRGLKEARETEGKYLESLSEKVAAVTRAQHLQQQLERVEEMLKERETLVSEMEKKYDEQKNHTHLMQDDLEAALLEEQKKRQVFEDQAEELFVRLDDAEKKLKSLEKAQLERDSSLEAAEQHFAKKVREAAFLSETLEEKEMVIISLQQEIDAHLAAISELESRKELEEAKEEELIQSREKISRLQVRIHELEDIEDKHAKMQALMMSLGKVIGSQDTDLATSEPVLGVEAPSPYRDLVS